MMMKTGFLMVSAVLLVTQGEIGGVEASWMKRNVRSVRSSARRLLQLIPSINCNVTNAQGCVVSGGVDLGPLGAGYSGGALALNAIPGFSNGGATAFGEVYGTYTNADGNKTKVDLLVYPAYVLGLVNNLVGASYIITNYSTTTSAGADVGNIQNILIPAYLQTNASQYNPAIGDTFPGNVGIKDNTIVNSLNDTASVTSGFSIPAGFYSNIPGGLPIQTRPDGLG